MRSGRRRTPARPPSQRSSNWSLHWTSCRPRRQSPSGRAHPRARRTRRRAASGSGRNYCLSRVRGTYSEEPTSSTPCLPLGRRNRQGMARKMSLLREGNGARSTIPAHRAGNGARLPEKKPAGVRCDSLLCRIIPASQPYRLWHTTFRHAGPFRRIKLLAAEFPNGRC